jgi:hypothetical protein
MKLDKETLIKQRFWVLAGLEVPLVLMALVVLVFGVRATVVAEQKKIEDQIDKPKGIKDPKNQAWIDRLNKEEAAVTTVLDAVWKEGWDSQADLVTWPQDVQARFNEGRFAVKVTATTPKGKPGKPPQTSAKEKNYLIRGVVTGKSDYRIDVRAQVEKDKPVVATVGKKKKEEKYDEANYRFYFTPHMKLAAGGKPEDEVESFAKVEIGDQVDVTYYQGKYFMDDFSDEEKDLFATGYFDQFPPLRDFLKGPDGKLVVAVRGGWREGGDSRQTTENMPSFLRKVMEWPKDPRPTAEKIWYSQEDFWMQRELLRVIQQANRYVSVFHGEGGAEEGRNFTFTNPYWKIDIQRQGNKFTGKLTNVSRQMQKLNVHFILQLTRPARRERPLLRDVSVDGPPLKPKRSVPFAWEIEGEPKGLFGVEQALTFETAPVKQLEDLRLDKHSHRTYPKGFTTWYAAPKKKAPEKSQGGGNVPPPDMRGGGGGPKQGGEEGFRPPGGGGGGKRGGRFIPGAGGGGEEEKKEDTERYSESTEQFRKLPVAMVLLVDQDSAHYVLTAFEESKLRFQITQVTLTRYPDKLQDPERVRRKKDKDKDKDKEKQGDKDGGTGSGTGTMRPPLGSGAGGMILRPMRPTGGLRPGGAGGGGGFRNPYVIGAQQPAGQGGLGGGYVGEQGAVMELVVYGYATLYERFPPKDSHAKQAKPAGAGPAPAQ